MRVNVSNAIDKVKASMESWEKIAPSVTALSNGVSWADVLQAFQQVVALLDVIENSEVDGFAWGVHKASFDSIPQQLNQTITPHAGNIAHINSQGPNICSWLWSIKTAALALIPIHPEAERLSPNFEQEISARIQVMQRQFAETEEILGNTRQTGQSASDTLAEILSHKVQTDRTVEATGKLLSTIQAHERDAGTAKTSASSAAVAAETDAKVTSASRAEIEEAIAKKDALIKEFEVRRSEIASLLENANKIGLARSFQEKRKSLTRTWIVWSLLFIVAITGIMAIALHELLPLLQAAAPSPVAVAIRFLVASPLVWLAWFAARQYGHTLRISEDYAFKEAAAMAFAGYRNEVESDADMLKLLRESAIRSFGSNPTDLLLKHPDAASPLHEALEKALEKLEPKEIIGALTTLVASIQKGGR